MWDFDVLGQQAVGDRQWAVERCVVYVKPHVWPKRECASLKPQRLDWIKLRRFMRGIIAGHEADENTDKQPNEHP